MDCSPPGSSVHGIFQARILEWIAISFSRAASWPRDWTQVSWTAGRFFTNLAKHYFWGLLIKFNIWYSSSFTATRNSSNHYIHCSTVSVWSTPGLWAPPTVRKQERLFRAVLGTCLQLLQHVSLTTLVTEKLFWGKAHHLQKGLFEIQSQNLQKVIPWAHEMKVKVTQSCLTLCDPMGLFRPEYWSR